MPLVYKYPVLQETCFTASNTSLEHSCYNHGKCINSTIAKGFFCDCRYGWDPITFCNSTLFDSYNGADLAYGAIALLGFVALFALFIAELLMDGRRASTLKSFFKRSPVFCKLCLITYCLMRMANMGIYLDMSTKRDVRLGSIYQILMSIGIIIFTAAYLTAIISWYDLLLKAKNLGVQQNAIRILRKVLIITCSIFLPIGIIARIISEFGILSSTMDTIRNFASGVSLIVPFVSSTVFLIKVEIWLRKAGKGVESKAITKAVKRNKFIWILNAAQIVVIIRLIMSLFVPEALSGPWIILHIWDRFFEIGVLTAFYFFLESYMTSYGCGRGYFLVWNGKIDNSSLNTGTTGSNSKKSTKSSSDVGGKSTTSTDSMPPEPAATTSSVNFQTIDKSASRSLSKAPSKSSSSSSSDSSSSSSKAPQRSESSTGSKSTSS